ncbi:MAG: MurT ligase domain-containing protein [Actinomycetota bacterium]|nr:MurT ligase domain-containing protein [Actinomycetota bacterium]
MRFGKLRRGLRESAAVRLARIVGGLSRRLRLGGGSSAPGLVVGRVDPGFVERRAAALPDGIIVVSGTNGKTTTTSMIRAILRDAGIETVSNESGANLLRGIATAFLDAPATATAGVFEIDEAWLVRMVPLLKPNVMVLTNVFRDQLDRFGEAESVAALLARAAAALPVTSSVVANADDPLLWYAVRDRDPVGFGVRPLGDIEGSHRGDAEPETCPKCGAQLSYTVRTIAHLGQVVCEACGWMSAAPEVNARILSAEGLDTVTLQVDEATLVLPVGGIHNAYNAAAAIAATGIAGVPVLRAATSLEHFRPRFGRSEEFMVDGRPVRLVLCKNPAGASVVIREMAADPRVGAVVVSVSDQIADGRDISWIWDADHERLAAMGVPIVPSGRRAADVAVRLKYAGATPAPAEPDPIDAIRSALARCPAGKATVVLATYTAMLDVRRAVSRSRSQRLVDSMPSPS